jgi:hypothetical protein
MLYAFVNACWRGGKEPMLTWKAQQLLRCKAYTRFGLRCRAYVVAGLEVCISHSPWRSRGPGSSRSPLRPGRCACRCAAYNWPHRRGSGHCQWPEAPAKPCETPSGKRRSPALKAEHRARMQALRKISKVPDKVFPKLQVPIQPSTGCVSRVGSYIRRV